MARRWAAEEVAGLVVVLGALHPADRVRLLAACPGLQAHAVLELPEEAPFLCTARELLRRPPRHVNEVAARFAACAAWYAAPEIAAAGFAGACAVEGRAMPRVEARFEGSRLRLVVRFSKVLDATYSFLDVLDVASRPRPLWMFTLEFSTNTTLLHTQCLSSDVMITLNAILECIRHDGPLEFRCPSSSFLPS